MQRTPLITQHRAASAKLVDFAGWEMPIQYKGVVEEYHAVLSNNFLLDYPMPTIAGLKTVLEDLRSRNSKVRELKPENLMDPRFLQALK